MLKKFLLTITGILAGIIIFEVFLRLFPGYSFDEYIGWSTVIKSEYHANHYRPSKIFGYELIPNSHPEINSFGMRDREYSLGKPPGVFRILLLGDSISEQGEWSNQVEKKLNQSGDYEILNTAVSAWGLRNYYRYLLYKGLNFDPDMVLIGFCLNDFNTAFVTAYMDRDKNEMLLFNIVNREGINEYDFTVALNPAMFRHSYLYRFLVLNYLELKNKILGHSNEMTEYEMIRKLKKLSGNRIAGIIFPYLKPLSRYERHERQEYEKLKKALSVCGIEYLDLHYFFNAFGADKIKSFRRGPNDKIHFNAEANRLKAQVIHDWLVKVIKKLKENKVYEK